jgi:hypothetical protein
MVINLDYTKKIACKLIKTSVPLRTRFKIKDLPVIKGLQK